MQNQQISFENTPVNIIHQDGKVWMTLTDVARCLYNIPETTDSFGLEKDTVSLEHAKRSVENIFKKKKDFIEKRGDTELVKFKEGNLYRSYRIFSRSGLYSIAFAAQTPKAEAFQNFVLDLLEKYDNGQQPVAIPAPEEHPVIEKTAGAQEDVMMNALKAAYNCLFPVMDNLRAYKDLWETRNILIHSAPRQALALNDALDGLYAAMQEDVQSSYTTLQDIVVGKKPKAKPSIHDFLERSSHRLSGK